MIRSEIVADSFDSGQLEAEPAEEVRGVAERVRGFIRASVIDVGRELLRVKERLNHGQFVVWVRR